MTRKSAYDLVVVGSGAAGLSAAIVAAVEGVSVLVVESTDLVGGTTAISGGMVWIGANRKMRAAGLDDDMEAVNAYLSHTLPRTDLPALRAFLDNGDRAIAYLEEHSSAVRLRPVMRYPDYHPSCPGATAGGRVLEPLPFDGFKLGQQFAMLRPPLPELTILGGMMVSREHIPDFRRFARSPRAAGRVAKLLSRYAWERLHAPRGTTLYLGNALVARLLRSALDAGVEIATATTADRLLGTDGRVVGVDLAAGGRHAIVRAANGVVLATGGISHDSRLRERYVPSVAFGESVTVSAGAAPSGAYLALAGGGRLVESTTHGGFWVPCSRFARRDGTPTLYPHIVTDRAKPGLIAVDQTGRRFVNEARSYHNFGSAQLERGSVANPAYLICDRLFLWRYGLGRVKPFSPIIQPVVASGYLITARTVSELAARIGVPPTSFVSTITEYNLHAEHGADPEFGRGSDIYQRHLGDPSHSPNPCVAPIKRPPFFALAIYTTDLGMSAGLLTDAEGRVLDEANQPIPGLYTCGNDMNSVMQGHYPGPGITLGPAMTFGYLTARAALADS